MIITEKEKVKLRQQGYDIDFLFRTQPKGGLKFGEKYINAGDGHIGCLHVYSFAETTPPLWLSSVLNISNTVAAFDMETANKAEVIKDINKSITELRDRTSSERKATDKNDAAYEEMQLQQFAHAITMGGEIVKLVHCRIFFYDFSFEDLEKRIGDIRKELNSINHKATIYLFQTKQEWMSLFRSYEQQERITNISSGQVLPSTSIGGGVPFHHQDLKDPRGIYLGQTSTGGAYMFDPFRSTEKRKSFNGFVLGMMGYGKSTFMKMLEEGLVARNTFIRGFDKARDYYDLVEGQGGKIIDLSGGKGMINPLEVLATKTNLAGTVIDEYGSFMNHLSKITNMYRFLNPNMETLERTQLRKYLREFYIDYGLLDKEYSSGDNKRKVKITGLSPDKYPIMSEFLAFIKKYQLGKVTPKLKQIHESIEMVINDMCTSYGSLFNGHTTLNDYDNEQIVMFDIDGLSQLEDNIFRCQLFTALTTIWNQALKNGRKMKKMIEENKATYNDINYFMVLLDECHNIISTNNLFAVEYVVSFEREMRKFSAGVFFATQSPQEILPENASDAATAVIKQVFELTQYKVFFNLDNSVMENMRRVLGSSLKETEFSLIPELEEGQAIFQVSSTESYAVNFDPENEQLARFKGGQ